MNIIRDKRGVVLLFTFIIIVTLAAVTAAFLYMTSTRIKGSGYDISSQKALWIAEGGLQYAMYRLKNDDTFRDGVSDDQAAPTIVTGSLGNGGYSVSVYKGTAGDPDEDIFYMTSTGSAGTLSRQVAQSADVNTAPEVYNYVLYAGNNIQTGNTTNLTITGDQESSAAQLPIVDFNYYQTNADPGQDISGAYTFTPGTYSGIWYIDGSVSIDNNVTINGTVVTTSRVTATNKNNIVINSTSPNPAIIANDNIDFSRSSDVSIEGFVYAGADGSGSLTLSSTNNLEIDGTAAAADNISLNRSTDATITYDSAIVNNPPPAITSGAAANVVIQQDWDEIVPAS